MKIIKMTKTMGKIVILLLFGSVIVFGIAPIILGIIKGIGLIK